MRAIKHSEPKITEKYSFAYVEMHNFRSDLHNIYFQYIYIYIFKLMKACRLMEVLPFKFFTLLNISKC